MSSDSLIRWMHLSDLNLKAEGSFVHDEAFARLMDSFASGSSVVDRPDLIFCTGDIAFSAQTKEYEIAKQFFYRLSEITKVPLERIFTVPGNHDMDRSRLRQAFRLELNDRQSAEQFFLSEEDLTFALRPFHNYIAFEKRVFGRKWTSKSPYLYVQCSIRDMKVSVVGLNTALLNRFDDSIGKMVIGYDLLKKILDKTQKDNPDLVVVLMHHPIEWIASFERDHVNYLLSKRTDFILHGHVHAPESYAFAQTQKGGVFLGSGSWERHQGHRRSYISVDVTQQKILVKPQIFNEAGAGRWEPYQESEIFFHARRWIRPKDQGIRIIDSKYPFDLRAYISELQKQYGYLSTEGFASNHTAPAIRIEELFVTPDVQFGGDTHTHIKISEVPDTSDVFALIEKGRRVLLLGDPGSGKTTLLKKLILNQSQELTESENLTKGQIGRGAMLPVYLPIRRIARSFDKIDNFVDNPIQHLVFKTIQPYGGTLDWIKNAFSEGRILLLLDGLDEVATEDTRIDVLQIITELSRLWPKISIVVTSRPLGFPIRSRKLQWPADGFLVCHIKPFSREQVESFVFHIFKSVFRDIERANLLASQLLEALRLSTSLMTMSSSPLMLWAIVLTYLDRGSLPSHRSDLFKNIIETLVERWDAAKGIDRDSPFAHMPIHSRLRVLQDLALSVHSKGSRKAAFTLADFECAFKKSSISKTEVVRDLQSILKEITERTGLLIQTNPESWTFVHRSFQEYLAAQAIIDSKNNPEKFLAHHMVDEWWREVVLLSLTTVKRQGRAYAQEWFEFLLNYAADIDSSDERAEACGLLASAMLDANGSAEEWFKTFTSQLVAIAVILLEDSHQPGSLWSRVNLARLLGKTGDPRIGWDDNLHFVVVPGGSSIVGSIEQMASEDEKPVSRVLVSTFLIGRYPVTNSQFLQFVVSGGYDNEMFWSGEFGRRTDIRALELRLKAEPNSPVTEISWFEAEAFCRWLNNSRPRSDGLSWRLPTEAEWEKAARGQTDLPENKDNLGQIRIFPWGDEWSIGKANAGGASNTITPVGIFPSGVGLCGIFDQAGNVGEWCLDGYWKYEASQNSDPLGMTSSAVRAVRGGNWESSPHEIRVSARSWHAPSERLPTVGFRIVASAVGPIPARPPNPFQPGIALSIDAPPPGRMDIISALTGRLADGGSCILLGPRRSGKTSILRFLQAVLGRRQSVRFLDLQGYPCRNPNFLAVSLEPKLSRHPHPAMKFRHILENEKEPVILLDELGRLRNADVEADPNVFEWLRSLGQHGATLVLAGTRGDWENVRLKDAEKPGSSFTNILKPFQLGPLQKGESTAFLASAAPDDVPIGQSRIGLWMFDLTGGWPFYLQVLAHSFVEEVRGKKIKSRSSKREIKRLYNKALLTDYEFIFRQQWLELTERCREIILRGEDGRLPKVSSLSPRDIEYIERQGLYSHRKGWILTQDKPFLDWLKIHHSALATGNGGADDF